MINYVKFPVCDPFAPVCGLESKFRYMAFILRPVRGSSAIDLGMWRISMPKCTSFTRRCHSQGRLLRGERLPSMRASCSRCGTLICGGSVLVPDGELHLLPFEYFPTGAPLGEAYEISYLALGATFCERIKPRASGMSWSSPI